MAKIPPSKGFQKTNWTKIEIVFCFFTEKRRKSHEKGFYHEHKVWDLKKLKENCSIDISNDVEFTSSKDVFRAVLIGLRKKDYAGMDHKPLIAHEDLRKMYRTDNIVINTTTPYGLKKV